MVAGSANLVVEQDICSEVLVVEVDVVLVVVGVGAVGDVVGVLVRVGEVVIELVLGHVGVTEVVYWYGVPDEYTNAVLVVV